MIDDEDSESTFDGPEKDDSEEARPKRHFHLDKKVRIGLV